MLANWEFEATFGFKALELDNVQRACLYDNEWQIMRVGFLGNWNDPAAIRINEEEVLVVYVAKSHDSLEERRRLYRVSNLYAAVKLGKAGLAQDAYNLVELFAADWHERYGACAGNGSFGEWNWHEVYIDMDNMELARLQDVHRNLRGRVATANYKARKGTGGMQHRSQLTKYLTLLTHHIATVSK